MRHFPVKVNLTLTSIFFLMLIFITSCSLKPDRQLNIYQTNCVNDVCKSWASYNNTIVKDNLGLGLPPNTKVRVEQFSEYYCNENKLKPLAFIVYDSKTGSSIYSRDYTLDYIPQKKEIVFPSSISSRILSQVCKSRNLKIDKSKPEIQKKVIPTKTKQEIKENLSWQPDLQSLEYISKVEKKIKRKWKAPKKNLNYNIKVNFKINSQGGIEDLKIISASGDTKSDLAALKAVKDASPFEPIPVGLEAPLEIEFSFDLKYG
jgi:TonB family protein